MSFSSSSSTTTANTFAGTRHSPAVDKTLSAPLSLIPSLSIMKREDKMDPRDPILSMADAMRHPMPLPRSLLPYALSPIVATTPATDANSPFLPPAKSVTEASRASLSTADGYIRLREDCPRFCRTLAGGHRRERQMWTHPREFFYHFKKHAQEVLGDFFGSQGHRLLVLAIRDDDLQYAVSERLKREPGASWERIEAIFISTTMTWADHVKDRRDLEPKSRLRIETQESFRQFVERYREIVEMYRIEDHDRGVLGYLYEAFEEQMVYLVLFGLLRGYPVRDGFISIAQFLDCLERIPGPFYNEEDGGNDRDRDLKKDGRVSRKRRKRAPRMSCPSTPPPLRYQRVQQRGGGGTTHCEHDTNECTVYSECGQRSQNVPEKEGRGGKEPPAPGNDIESAERGKSESAATTTNRRKRRRNRNRNRSRGRSN